MIKSELVRKLAEQNPHLYARDIEKVVNTILVTIADALAPAVILRQVIALRCQQKIIPVFKIGKEMHHCLNPTSPGAASGSGCR